MASDTQGKVIHCKAAVAWEKNKPLTIEDIEVAPPKKGEVRVKIHATGVCHTDAYTLDGHDPEGIFPVILGHEGAGVVESVGEGVTSVKPGDHVICLYTPECGDCKMCHSPKTNLCSVIRATQGAGVMPDGTSRFTAKGKQLFHFMGCSTFSEYTVLAEISVVKISESVPFKTACLMGCGITTGYGAAVKVAKIEKGSTVAVIGVGGVGLSVIQGARENGASRIVAVDINDEKIELAKKFGATEGLNPSKLGETRLQDKLVEMTTTEGVGGFDYTFECVGNVDLMRAALEATHKGWGESYVIGVAAAGKEISTRPFQLVTGRSWSGCAFGGIKGRSELPALVDKFNDKSSGLLLDEYVSQVVPLDRINEAFDIMHAKGGVSIRTVVEY